MSVEEQRTLVYRSLDGDHDAFGQLIDYYKNGVFGLLLHRIRDFDQAEDLAQETFLQAYLHLGSLKAPEKFAHWLYGIARNLCSRWLARRARESEVLEQHVPVAEKTGGPRMFSGSTPPTPEDEYTSQEMKDAIWQAIGALPEKSREVLLLSYFNEMSSGEVAAFLGVGPSTVRSHLRHGRERLKDRMLPLVKGVIGEKRLTQRFTARVVLALPLLPLRKPPPKPILPPGRGALSLKSRLLEMGLFALNVGLIAGLIGLLALGRGDKPTPGGHAPLFPGIQVRLATPDERAQFTEHLSEEEEMEMMTRRRSTVMAAVLGMVTALTGPAVEADSAAVSDKTSGGNRDTTVVLPGGATMEFVWIEPGTFIMGSPALAPGRAKNEGPLHQVRISRGFYLGKYELTQGQWEAVMGSRPWGGEVSGEVNPRNPAVYISWDEVQELIDRLNAAEGRPVYRLPTEAEWEYACRAGTTTQWSFGSDEGLLGNYAWFSDNSGKNRHPVGEKRANPWGLFDMHGNVWEMVQDKYGSAYYSQSPALDPPGLDTGSDRGLRGGGFNLPAHYTRSTHRGRLDPSFVNVGVGVRLVRMGSWGCDHPTYSGPLRPAAEQAGSTTVADDGTVVFAQNRLEMGLRPVTAGELSRQANSTQAQEAFQNFTVFHLAVKNYGYPKVRIDPASVMLHSTNGPEYRSLASQQLGNNDLLRQAFLWADPVFNGQEAPAGSLFSGQEVSGYIVFPALCADARDIQVAVKDVVLRFDYRGVPIEATDVTYRFGH